MAHTEVIRHRAPTRMGRLWESIRSYSLGPWSLKDPALAEFYRDYRGGTVAGVSVTESNALMLSAVWQAVTLIAGDVGSLPLQFYKRGKDDSRERYTDHPLYYILHDAPNSEMSSMVFRETLQAHALTWGNAYAEIERDMAGRVVALWPLLPSQVQPFRNELGQLKYRVRNPNGTDLTFDKSEILHVPGMGFDGTVGYSVIQQARESLGLLSAAEKFGATFFGNGTAFGGALSHPKVLGLEGQKTLRSSIESLHKGPEKAHRFLILEEGMSYQQFGIAPNDAQFLETRQFQIAEVARWFNLPLHKLREMKDSSVRANIEQEALDYYVSTLRPWLTRWEQEINRKLVSPREKYIQFAEFNLDGVLRGDLASRYAAYAVGRQWGWLSQNDIRRKENMNPIPDGDAYLSPTNMVPSNRLDEVIDKQVEPTPAPVVSALTETTDEDDEAERAAIAAFMERLEAQATTIGALQARNEQLVDAAAVRQQDIERLASSAHAVQKERDEAVAKADQAWAMLADGLAERDGAREAWQNEAEERRKAEAVLDPANRAIEASRLELAAVRAELATTVDKAIEADRAHVAHIEQLEAQRAAEQAEAEKRIDVLRADVERESARGQALADRVDELTTELEGDRAALAERNTEVVATNLAAAAAVEAQAVAELAQAEAVAAKDAAEQAAQRAVATAAEAVQASQKAEAALVEARERQQAAEQALAVERDGTADLMTRLATAHRAVYLDTMTRLVAHEGDKAKRQTATPDKLRSWVKTFYPQFEQVCADRLLPVAIAHAAVVGGDPVAMAKAMAAAHVEESTRQVAAVADCEPAGDMAGYLTRTVEAWERSRPDAFADALVREAFTHVRREFR